MTPQPPITRKRILVMDDSITIRKMAKDFLRDLPYDVSVAATSAEGLSKAKAGVDGSPFDLLLLDFTLNDMTGVEFLQELARLLPPEGLPTVMLSGNGEAIQELYHNRPNVIGYLTKPFEPEPFVETVRRKLDELHERRMLELAEAEEAANEAAGATVVVTEPTPAMEPVAVPPITPPVTPTVVPVPVAPPTPVAVATPVPPPLPVVAHVEPVPAAPETAVGVTGTGAATDIVTEGVNTGDPIEAQLRQELFRVLADHLLNENVLAEGVRAAAERISAHHQNVLASPRVSAGTHPGIVGPLGLFVISDLRAYLAQRGSTGQLDIALPGERISAFFIRGSLVAVTSDEPKRYCFGSNFPFSQVPRGVLSAALARQQLYTIPAFVTIADRGFVPPAPVLGGAGGAQAFQEALRWCGDRCLARAQEGPADARVEFLPRDAKELPPYCLTYPVNFNDPAR